MALVGQTLMHNWHPVHFSLLNEIFPRNLGGTAIGGISFNSPFLILSRNWMVDLGAYFAGNLFVAGVCKSCFSNTLTISMSFASHYHIYMCQY